MTTLGRRLAVVMVGWIGLVGAAAVHGQGPLPFSETYRRPSVSPYTMLTPTAITSPANGVGPAAGSLGYNPLVYQQLVQPRVQQEQGIVNQMRQGRQIEGLSSRVQTLQRGGGFGRVTAAPIRPTGHGASYLNLSHYYGR